MMQPGLHMLITLSELPSSAFRALCLEVMQSAECKWYPVTTGRILPMSMSQVGLQSCVVSALAATPTSCVLSGPAGPPLPAALSWRGTP